MSYHRLGCFNPVVIDAQPFARRSEGIDLLISDDKYETTKTIHRNDEGWLSDHRFCPHRLCSEVTTRSCPRRGSGAPPQMSALPSTGARAAGCSAHRNCSPAHVLERPK